jgi:hypothetical protein
MYVKWLIVYAVSLALGAVMMFFETLSLIGFFVAAVSLGFDIFYLIKILEVAKIEKECIVCEGKFVSSEQTSVGWKNPKFSITVELEIDGEKIFAKTAGVYGSYEISNLTTQSIVKVGYNPKYEQIITL